MAKSIFQRAIDQGVLAIIREATRPLTKELGAKVKELVEGQKKKTGKRRDNED